MTNIQKLLYPGSSESSSVLVSAERYSEDSFETASKKGTTRKTSLIKDLRSVSQRSSEFASKNKSATEQKEIEAKPVYFSQQTEQHQDGQEVDFVD